MGSTPEDGRLRPVSREGTNRPLRFRTRERHLTRRDQRPSAPRTSVFRTRVLDRFLSDTLIHVPGDLQSIVKIEVLKAWDGELLVLQEPSHVSIQVASVTENFGNGGQEVLPEFDVSVRARSML